MAKCGVMTFNRWLRRYKGERCPIGDLATDAASDQGFPQNIKCRADLLGYLTRKGACYEALNAAREAWLEFKPNDPANGERADLMRLSDRQLIMLYSDAAAEVEESHGEDYASDLVEAILSEAQDRGRRYEIEAISRRARAAEIKARGGALV